MIKLPDGLQEEQIICLMKFGSHLYGTDTPDSDIDYKGVYLPTKKQILLQDIPKSYSITPKKQGEGVKNEAGDIDMEIYSLHYFLKLAMEGQTVAIDMLHADLGWNDATMLPHWPLWVSLHNNRQKFYTKNLKAFVGYARKQAAKYGIKGSRLNAAKMVIDFLEVHDPDARLANVWDRLPAGEHIHKMDNSYADPLSPVRTYQVCGKQIQSTVKVSYALDILRRFYKQYGARARQAANNEGVDWKAVSHAVRAAFQLVDIYLHGDIKFPLQGAHTLRDIKQGKIPWSTARLWLEDLIEYVEELAAGSDYPEKVDRKFWDSWMEVMLTDRRF